MLTKIDDLMNLLKKDTFLPAPLGSWEVGYIDIMTEGLPEDSSFLRIYYPTTQKHEFLPERCPIWTEHDTKHGFINFIQAMVSRWPTWVNNTEFGLKGLASQINLFGSWVFKPVFSLGWGLMSNNPRIPVIHQAQLAENNGKFPLVVFSHGMGCNRYAYSKVCYDLCSEGFIVASVEHRDGSACHSSYTLSGKTFEIPHLQLKESDDELKIRNKQLNQRVSEVSRAMDLLVRLNEGTLPRNRLSTEDGFKIDFLTGKFDLEKSFLLGHSFGGCTVIKVGSLDQRFKAVVTIDPWMFPVSEENFRVRKPVLMIGTEHFVHESNVNKVREMCEDLVGRVLKGAVHLVHTDAPMLFENDLFKSGLGFLCSRDTEEVLAENHSILHSWIKSLIDGTEVERVYDFGESIS